MWNASKHTIFWLCFWGTVKPPELLTKLAPWGYGPPKCSCPPNPSIAHPGDYKAQSINWRALIKTPPGLNPSYHATHQPGRTKAALSHCLLALLYMSQDALSLCAHIFFRVSLSLSIFLCLFLHLYLTLPRFPLVICFSPVGFGIPFRERIIQFLSFPEDGPRAVEWVSVPPPPPHPHTSPTHSSLLAMQWCHGFYLLWGYTLILSRYYTLHISHFQPPTLTNLHSCFPQPVHFPDSLASQRVPGGFGDVSMLCQTSLVHVRHPKERQPPFPMVVPVLNLIDLTFFCHPHISNYCRNNEVKTIINLISTLLIWFFFVGADFREASLPLGWYTLGWEMYFILNKTPWLQSREPNHIHSSQWNWLISLHVVNRNSYQESCGIMTSWKSFDL